MLELFGGGAAYSHREDEGGDYYSYNLQIASCHSFVEPNSRDFHSSLPMARHDTDPLSKMCCRLFSCRVESLCLSQEALFLSDHLLALSPNPLLPNLKGRHFPKDAQSFTLLLPESCNVDLTPVLMSKRLKTWE